MGLDGVELVMAFEEAFGVAIEDVDAEKMLTPRAVIDFIESRVGAGTKRICLTRRAFHGIRGRLMTMGFQRQVIRPNEPLARFFPKSSRRRLWVEARGSYSKLQWPELVRTPVLQNLINLVPLVVASVTLIAIFGRLMPNVFGPFALAGLAALVSWLVLMRMTQSQCRRFPRLVTIRDLAVRVAGFTEPDRANQRLSRAEIAGTVKQTILDQLGIPEAAYHEDKDFIRDFGVG